jgi:hypothetical protein
MDVVKKTMQSLLSQYRRQINVIDAKKFENGANGSKRPNDLLINGSRFWLESARQEEQKNRR